MSEPSPAPPHLAWNVLVTAREGVQRHLRPALRPLVRLRSSGFRNVFVGQVDDPEGLLSGIAGLRERRPSIDRLLGKVLPIERTFVVDRERFQGQLREEATPFLDRLQGRSFHVRVERRGHKGVINTHASELALGEYLYNCLQQRNLEPVVAFHDPEVVIAIEVIGMDCGIAVITRDLRQRFPFVKID